MKFAHTEIASLKRAMRLGRNQPFRAATIPKAAFFRHLLKEGQAGDKRPLSAAACADRHNEAKSWTGSRLGYSLQMAAAMLFVMFAISACSERYKPTTPQETVKYARKVAALTQQVKSDSSALASAHLIVNAINKKTEYIIVQKNRLYDSLAVAGNTGKQTAISNKITSLEKQEKELLKQKKELGGSDEYGKIDKLKNNMRKMNKTMDKYKIALKEHKTVNQGPKDTRNWLGGIILAIGVIIGIVKICNRNS